jgi:hypothetical protein
MFHYEFKLPPDDIVQTYIFLNYIGDNDIWKN